ncbi:MAG: proline dehydrogenase family protein [Bacteroidales bacterium]|nr:proline dehydrogenase family protein [Bacteroidales bacterium]
MISFSNTEAAFAHYSNRDLFRARVLFGIMANPILSPIYQFIAHTRIKLKSNTTKRLNPIIYKQFVGGRTLEECDPIVDKIWNHRSFAQFLHIPQNSSKPDVWEDNYNEIIKNIEASISNPRIAFVQIKPTHLIDPRILRLVATGNMLNAKDQDLFLAFKERINSLCRLSYNGNRPIVIDTEESWYHAATDCIIDELMEEYNHSRAIVYKCYQMYLQSTLDKLFGDHQKSMERNYTLGAKIIRGAYIQSEWEKAREAESECPVFESLEETSQEFNKAIKFVLSNIDSMELICATHNEDTILYTLSLMESLHIGKNNNRVYFSHLYGMADYITFNLAQEGYNVVKNIPYGLPINTAPYLKWIATEGTGACTIPSREVSLIKKEIKRRRRRRN